VIAELKRRSPSKGLLNEAIDPGSLASAFEQGGAAAISVLTEPMFFGGSTADLEAVRAAVRLPILRKDFHLHTAQLKQAQAERASAVLLIARALSPRDLPELMKQARLHGLETVVEVRSEAELERALDAGAEIVGVNSRDLETLEVDDRVPQRLIPRLPPTVLAIWESGIASVADVKRAAESGADAVLVGSALSRSADPIGLVRSLTQVPRRSRDG
jgi:indole-3-glycerol phosphate synthase